MRDHRHGPRAARLILAIAMMLGWQGAAHAGQDSPENHPRAHATHKSDASADEHDAHKKHLYFRPGCRRNHRARSKSAPCWE